jgi:glycosyltransferase involved in cell wall biosynthesis
MKILTVSASPYLLTKLGKMNGDILSYLKSQEYEVSSCVWHFDPSWFAAMGQDDVFKYEKNGEYICDLFPFVNHPEMAVVQVYEVIKKVKPDIVISIGDYQDTSFIFAIKSLYPKSFKWMNILTIDALPINENQYESFPFMDCIVSTTQEGRDAVCSINNNCHYISYGPDHDSFFYKGKEREEGCLRVICCGKNSEASNIAIVMKATHDVNSLYFEKPSNKITTYFHTNYGDKGEYDLSILRKRFDTKNIIKFPEKFVGLNDGISEIELNEEYNKADAIIDISVRSATGLTVLEAMSTGCIPIVTGVGALKEIIKGKKIGFVVSSNLYIGGNEEYFEIASVEYLTEILYKLYNMKKQNIEEIKGMREKCIEESKRYCNKKFVREIEGLLKDLKNKEVVLKIDIFDKK